MLSNKITFIDNLIKLHFTYFNLIMPGLANSYLQIMIIVIRAVGPAVDVFRCHYGVDHLHESCRSMDFSSIRKSVCFTVGVSIVLGVLPRKCKGTREYARKP